MRSCRIFWNPPGEVSPEWHAALLFLLFLQSSTQDLPPQDSQILLMHTTKPHFFMATKGLRSTPPLATSEYGGGLILLKLEVGQAHSEVKD